MKTTDNQRGFVHIVMIVVAVVVVGAVGFVAWQAFSKKAAEQVVNGALTEAARQECEKKNDKDLCKFMTSWKASAKYSMTSTDASGAKMLFEVDGDKSHMKSTGEQAYEVITIDKTTYTKAGDVWYKQTIKTPDQDVAASSKVEFDEPSEDTSKPSEDKTVYKALGKEACGNLNCFKYQVVDPSNKDTTEFIWFDDKDYLLRKTVTETPEGKSETTFAYDNVTVKVPSPVKELAADQYIMPGSTEPATMPTAADLGQN